MLFQLTGRLIDVKALVSGSAVAKNVSRTPTSSVSSSVYSASVSRTTADITLLANNPIFAPDQVSFSAFRCQYQAFTSSFWIRYFTKWSLLGKRECVTRSFSVAFHHTLANSQLWAVLDDSRSGWRDASGFKAWSTDNDWKSHDLTEVVRIVSNAARRTGREIDGTLKIIS